jgi:hypothetical protein
MLKSIQPTGKIICTRKDKFRNVVILKDDFDVFANPVVLCGR